MAETTLKGAMPGSQIIEYHNECPANEGSSTAWLMDKIFEVRDRIYSIFAYSGDFRFSRERLTPAYRNGIMLYFFGREPVLYLNRYMFVFLNKYSHIEVNEDPNKYGHYIRLHSKEDEKGTVYLWYKNPNHPRSRRKK